LNAFAQYFENYVAEQREETLRWTICLAVVLAVHGTVGFYLRQSIETSEFGIDLPVVMLELPEVPPPPVEEKKEEPPPPPPEEEVKPPEPEPEVMPPEPPKPVVEDKPPPPPVVTIPRTLIATWQGRLAAHIERFKRYPLDARERGEQGLAKVAFTIDHEGHLLGSRIVQSSGSPALDQETLDMLTRAQPMPTPPEGLPDSALSFVVPVRFNIR
jgi:protein TonB